MEKMNIKRFLVMLLVISFTGALKAQSIRWADTNEEYVRKINDNLYEPVPMIIASFKIEDNKFWVLLNGMPEESGKPRGYLSREGDKIHYFDSEDKMLGYYVPETNRYYIVTVSEGGEIIKEDQFAFLYEGDLYAGLGEIRFKVDMSFSPEVLGFFLFIN